MMGSECLSQGAAAGRRAGHTDDAGITVGRGARRHRLCRTAPLGQRQFDSYLELHIEQAPVLDREGCDVGIVVGGYKTQALKLTISRRTPAMPAARRWRCGANALVGAGYVIAAVNDIGLAYAAEEGAPPRPHRKLPQPARHLCER